MYFFGKLYFLHLKFCKRLPSHWSRAGLLWYHPVVCLFGWLVVRPHDLIHRKMVVDCPIGQASLLHSCHWVLFDRQHNAMACVAQVRGVLLLALNCLAMNIGLGIGLAALLRDFPLKVFNST